MVKSIRAGRVQANKRLLRSRVFQPVEDARVERLSAKLREITERPKINDKAKEGNLQIDENGRLIQAGLLAAVLIS